MKNFKLSVFSVALFTMGLPAHAATNLFNVENIHKSQQILKLKKDVEKRTLFSLNKSALQQSTNTLNIMLDDQLNIKFNKTKAIQSKSGSMIWQGEVSSEFLNLHSNSSALSKQQNSAILVARDGTITGTIRYEGKLYRIRSVGKGTHSVERINEESMQDHADDYIDPPSSAPDINTKVSVLAGPPVLDVLVVYTASAANQSGNIISLIDLAETETNIGYTASGVNTSINIVHSAQVDYSETSNSVTDLNRLAGTNDGYMDEVHNLRDNYGADMVVLVSDVSGYCGRADAIYANAASAFAIVDFNCATGYYSFGHELGHLQGARHDPHNDPTTSPFSYGHGYQDPAQNWRTVMAYDCTSGCSRQLFWSNPARANNGSATGTHASSNNARVLNNTATTMAGFRNSGTPGLECQYSANSYVEEYYEEYRDYGEGEWKYRWNGSTIASDYGHVNVPDYIDIDAYRYNIGQRKYSREGGPSRDEYWKLEKYQICRTAL